MKKTTILTKPVLLLLLSLLTYQIAAAQNIAINSTGNTPDASALLDIQATNKGVLIPQIDLLLLTGDATNTGISNPAHSLLIYNAGSNLTKGYYYNSGTSSVPVWVKLTTSSDALTMTTIGSSPNANGASISSGSLSLQPANASFGGVVTTGTQTFAGDKTFNGDLTPAGRLMLPMGEVSYFSTTGTTVLFSAISNGTSNMVKCAPASTLANDMDFDNGGANNGRLRYVGALTRTFHIAFTLSATPSTSNNIFVMGIAKNGTVQTSSKVMGTSSGTQFSAMHVMLSLSPNDYLELYIGNMSSTSSLTVKTLNMFALGM